MHTAPKHIDFYITFIHILKYKLNQMYIILREIERGRGDNSRQGRRLGLGCSGAPAEETEAVTDLTDNAGEEGNESGLSERSTAHRSSPSESGGEAGAAVALVCCCCRIGHGGRGWWRTRVEGR